MKKILKWTIFVLAAVAAMAAGMYFFAQYLDSKEPSCDNESVSKSGSKSFNRHYTKLNL